jgi:hypothetical protein
MKPVQAYLTSDGQLFHSEDKAKLHEMFLSKKDIVEEYLDSDLNAYKGHANRGMAKTTIINWELWKTQNVK